MSVITSVKTFFQKIIEFLKKIMPKIDTAAGWLPFTNSQLKWSFGITLRVVVIIICLFLTLVLVKQFDIAKRARDVFVHDLWGIIDKGSTVISSPDINYNDDLKSIDDVIKMMESKKKGKANETNTKAK